MRTLSANALTKIQTAMGTEPVIIVEVLWGGDIASEFYADKSIPEFNVTGRILSLSGLDDAVQVSGGAQSQQINITLSDHDGRLKSIFDANDVHKKQVRVWQWFTGLTFAEKFLVFAGQINSPVVWDEGVRTFSFVVVNRIEDVEVGFSAEEGDFPVLPEDLIGKPWPLCFGTCINVPALKAVPAVSGTLAHGVGIKDFTLANRIELANDITCPRTPVGFRCGGTIGSGVKCTIAYEDDAACIQARCVEIERLNHMLEEQTAHEYSVLTIFGGNKFPQGKTITLNIGGGLFTGLFTGTALAPTDTFLVSSRRHPLNDGSNRVIKDDIQQEIETECEGDDPVNPNNPNYQGPQDENFVDSIFGPLYVGVRDSRLSWEKYRKADQANFFWAGGGTAVTMQGGNKITYVANILPSTILRVSAYRTVNGNRQLLTVPSSFYTIQQTNYTGYQVMEIQFDRPLSRESQDTGGGWEDDIFVSLTSTVGPNTVAILRWFIETYSDHAIDETSFDATELLVENYPMHFPLLFRKNLISVLQDIARQARCVLWLTNGTFKIKYLSTEPATVATISEADILRDKDDPSATSLQIELTKTEDLVTKYTAKWRVDYAIPKENTLILRHNLKKYGTHEKQDDYYTYNILDLVRKSATYWLIRFANTWKRVRFSTSLKYLNVETNDAVQLSLPDVATSSFTAIVEKAIIDTDRNRIDFECWCPVRAGEMSPYVFAWPADVAEQALYPTIEDRSAGNAGSGTLPNFTTVAPPNHPLNIASQGGIISGFGLTCNGDAQAISSGVASQSGECRQDHGDKKPSDEGDVKPTPPAVSDNTGAVSSDTSPIANGAGTGFFSGAQAAKDQNNLNDHNTGKARETAERAAESSGANSGINPGADELQDMLDQLPEPDELDEEEHPCQVRVSVRTIPCFENNQHPGQCLPTGMSKNEVYVFNSCTAAKAAAAAFQALHTSCTEGGDCDNKRNVLVGIPGCSCEPPEGEEPGVIGYSSSGDSDAPPALSLVS